ELTRAFPANKYIYYADNKNAPFGGKNEAELDAVIANALTYFLKRGAEHAVFACNTTSTLLFKRGLFSDSSYMSGILPPTPLRPRRTLLLATPATVRNLTPQRGLKTAGIAELVPAIESNIGNLEKVKPEVIKLLPDFRRIETVILGCTHYPFISEYIAEKYPGAKLITGTPALLEKLRLRFCERIEKGEGGEVEFEFSGENKAKLYASLLEKLVENK
ncbi:MAG TPA: hypothetical protein P5161_06845, partial [Eubacteriales bacterium]|nr:hypothetical protein [Eubacteriales bacterium]